MSAKNLQSNVDWSGAFYAMMGLLYIVMFMAESAALLDLVEKHDEYSRYFGSAAFSCSWWFNSVEIYTGTIIVMLIWLLIGFLTVIKTIFKRSKIFKAIHAFITICMLCYFLNIGNHLGC